MSRGLRSAAGSWLRTNFSRWRLWAAVTALPVELRIVSSGAR